MFWNFEYIDIEVSISTSKPSELGKSRIGVDALAFNLEAIPLKAASAVSIFSSYGSLDYSLSPCLFL